MKFVRTEETSQHPAAMVNVDSITSIYLGEFTVASGTLPTLWARVAEGDEVKDHPLRICETEEEAREYLERFAKIAGNAIDITSHKLTHIALG